MKISGGGVYSAGDGSLKLTAGAFTLNQANLKRLTSDQAGINGTQAIAGMTLALAASTNYAIKGHILILGGAATLMQLQVHALAAGASIVWLRTELEQSAQTLGFGAADNMLIISAVTTNMFNSGPGGSAVNYSAEIDGLFTIGVNATTFQLDIVDTGVTNTVKAGSWVEATIIA